MDARSGSAPAGGAWNGNGVRRASRSARSLLFTVIGEYLRDPGASLWTAGVVAAMDRLGIEERAARQALTRTARDGWLVAERHGRRTLWRLTSRAADHFTESAESVYQAGRHPTGWDGDWTVLVTSVPESQRELRHRLRTRLRWAGFGSLGQGVWISPRVGSETAARQVLDELGITASAVSIVGRIGGLGSEFEVVNRAWDLGGLARDYAAFVAEFSDRREHEEREPAVVFTEQTRMVHRWREFALRDPVLPAELRPARWPGHDARDLFFRRHDADHSIAAEWLGAIARADRLGGAAAG